MCRLWARCPKGAPHGITLFPFSSQDPGQMSSGVLFKPLQKGKPLNFLLWSRFVFWNQGTVDFPRKDMQTCAVKSRVRRAIAAVTPRFSMHILQHLANQVATECDIQTGSLLMVNSIVTVFLIYTKGAGPFQASQGRWSPCMSIQRLCQGTCLRSCQAELEIKEAW